VCIWVGFFPLAFYAGKNRDQFLVSGRRAGELSQFVYSTASVIRKRVARLTAGQEHVRARIRNNGRAGLHCGGSVFDVWPLVKNVRS